MASLTDVLIWRNQDGTIQVTQIFSEGQLSKESVNDYVQRTIDECRKAQPALKDLPVFTYNRAEYKQLAEVVSKRHLKIDDKGKLTVDLAYVTDKDKRNQIKASIAMKLSSILSPDEIELLIR